MKEQHKAWGINTNSDEGHGLLGKYWWFNDKLVPIPMHMDGYLSAVFMNRKEARRALHLMKSKPYQAFPKATVVRLLVTIEVIK